MTDERQALFELIEKRADTDFVRELLAFAAEEDYEAEIIKQTGTGSLEEALAQARRPAAKAS